MKELYEMWNKKINVISRKDLEFLYVKHVLHSLSIAKIVKFKAGSNILDVGTQNDMVLIQLKTLS